MIFDFDAMETQLLPHFKDGEGALAAEMFADEHNRILRGRLVPGASVGLHTHTGSSEIIYVLSGEGKVLYDGAEERVRAGLCHYCPEGHTHTLINDSVADLLFFAVVPQHGAQ